jgi:Tol biopolymer transport system component
MKHLKLVGLMIAAIFFIQQNTHAQYFGKNKPRYRDFEFKVLKSPHFELYHYLKKKDKAEDFLKMTEQWYDYHRQVIGLELPFKNPLILYNNHAEFQQTNTIDGSIGVGTGGVTEAFKNRVVMPLTVSNQTTWQVLGHELVHAFQFYSILNGDSTSIQSLGNLPLWVVEGMAEYMSLGRVDPWTSMWMRDAVVNEDVPSLMKMDNPKYFAYRYGQAFWSFMTGTFGDDVINPFFRNTAIYGLQTSPLATLGIKLEDLSQRWEMAMKSHYTPYLRDGKEKPQGKLLFSKENAGGMNVCPSLSPNGRYVVFLSEKDLFTTDLYLADVRTGKIIGKVASQIKDSNLDNYNFLESSGAWSPDGKDFAFVAFKKGKNVLVVKDADAGKTIKTITIPGVDAFTNPAWSPDKNSIVVTGLVEGQPDLYLYNLKSKRVTQLTDDKYSEVLSNFNADGSQLTFSYDKKSVDEGRRHGAYTYDIAVMNMTDKSIKILDVFHGAENVNPNFDHEGNIYFISERDGFRNLYRYITSTGKVYQMTDLLTGISGITRYAPAISVATNRDVVLYTHYFKNDYNIYEGKQASFLNKEVDPVITDQAAGILPIDLKDKTDIVGNNLRGSDKYEQITDISSDRYKPKFKLDYLGGGTGVGVGNSSFGNSVGAQGGIQMLFSDMLGNHQIFSQVALNGDILDFGGQVSYLNRTHRIAWGVGISHQPLRTGYQDYGNITEDGKQYLVSQTNLIRVFDKSLSAFVHYPFSTTLRLEGGVSGTHRGFRQDQYNEYYQVSGNQYFYVGEDRMRIPIEGDRIQFDRYFSIVRGLGSTANVALVGDNSFFGMTSPLAGHRYRIGVDKSFGADDYTSFTADYRKYFWKKPFSLAIRGTGIMRYENEVSSVYPYYVGNNGFVRGYGSIISSEIVDDLGLDFYQLLGSKMGIFSAEVRVPFTGPKQLALIGTNFLLSDVFAFVDAGMAFNSFDAISNGEEYFTVKRDNNGNVIVGNNGEPIYANQTLKPALARSVGVGIRINLLGAFIVEPHLARQIQSNGKWTFGLNLTPGW